MVVACVGSDAPAGGGDADAGAPETGVPEGAAPDVSAPVDGGADVQGPGDGAADAPTGFDAGPPAWTATIPAGTAAVVEVVSNLKCRIEMVSVQTEVAPPKWELYLRKVDQPGDVCNEPKGVRALASGYTMPAASLAHRRSDDKLGMAYSMRRNLSGSSPVVLTMSQVDWWSGNDMHTAIMKTKTVVGAPANPSLDLTELFFTDAAEQAAGTLRLLGTGSFPGETGTGASFNARYDGFISDVGQPASAADDCVRVN